MMSTGEVAGPAVALFEPNHHLFPTLTPPRSSCLDTTATSGARTKASSLSKDVPNESLLNPVATTTTVHNSHVVIPKSPTMARDSLTRGLEQRACLERQRPKDLAIRFILKASSQLLNSPPTTTTTTCGITSCHRTNGDTIPNSTCATAFHCASDHHKTSPKLLPPRARMPPTPSCPQLPTSVRLQRPNWPPKKGRRIIFALTAIRCTIETATQ